TRANDLLFTSRTFMAEEALDLGLVNAVLPPEELMDHAEAYARNLAVHVSPASLRETKRQVYRDLHGGVGQAVEESERLLREMAKGPEYLEGVRALVEKRPPRFR
ncbi:MAG: enoyl-CoA hydratase-related protein, partial [Dehalococcoidia bacterium]